MYCFNTAILIILRPSAKFIYQTRYGLKMISMAEFAAYYERSQVYGILLVLL